MLGKHLSLCVLLAIPTSSLGADDSSAFGTHAIEFQQARAGGELIGCMFVFRAVHADSGYLRGAPVIAIGNFGLQVLGRDSLPRWTLKLGLMSETGALSRPTQAYLLGKRGKTAPSKAVSMDGEEGYRLFLFQYDETANSLIEDILAEAALTIAFNRVSGGVDVLVPLDLTVYESVPMNDARFGRKRSKAAITEFTKCLGELVDNAQNALEQESSSPPEK